MRAAVIFVTLAILLAASWQVNRIAQTWHYIVQDSPGELLYVASFDAAPDWQLNSDQKGSAQLADGALQITVDRAGQGVYSVADPYFSDFDLRVDVWMQSGLFDGTNNNGYGVVFRQQDDNNYYAFLISSDGIYRIRRVVNGNPTVLSAWIADDAIRRAPNALNRLRIVARQDRFQFYINDVPLILCIPNNPDGISTMFNGECFDGTFRDLLVDDTLPAGRIGLIAELDRGQRTGLAVRFDHVVVYAPLPLG